MLVLRRKTDEAIVLNNVIVIRVLSVEGDRVKLGIAAPPDVIVVREELLDETRNASRTTPPLQPRREQRPYPSQDDRR